MIKCDQYLIKRRLKNLLNLKIELKIEDTQLLSVLSIVLNATCILYESLRMFADHWMGSFL